MNRASVLLTDHPWSGTEIEDEILSSRGFRLIEAPEGADKEQLLELAGDVAAIMTCWAPVDHALISRSTNLRMISRIGVGLDNIDLQAASNRGIVVTNVPDYCIEEVSDHVVALIHSWARGIVTYDRDVRAGNWLPGSIPLRRVSDLTIGVVGLGRIGHRTAVKLAGLGCRILGFDEYVDRSSDHIEIVALSELIEEADVVTIHVPLLPETSHTVNASFLGAMRSGSLLVNASRGGLVDTSALVAALQHGPLGAAAVDVLESEPTIPRELGALDNLIITPHVAFLSDLSVIELRTRAAEQVGALLSGEQPSNQVTLPTPE